MEPNNQILPALVASLEKSGNDKLIITSTGSANGSQMRIEIQEGIIRMGGEAARQFGGGMPPGAE